MSKFNIYKSRFYLLIVVISVILSLILVSFMVLGASFEAPSDIAGFSSGSTGGASAGGNSTGGGGAFDSLFEEASEPYPTGTSYLFFQGAIYCDSDLRGEGKVVYWDEAGFYDGAGLSGFDGSQFSAPFDQCTSCYANYSACPNASRMAGTCPHSPMYCNLPEVIPVISSGKKDKSEEKATVPNTDHGCAVGWGSEPSFSFNPASEGYPNNPKFFRYEGSCKTTISMTHEKNPGKKNSGEMSHDEPGDYCNYEIGMNDSCGGTQFQSFIDSPGCSFCNYEVDWDNNKNACERLGGAWLDDSSFKGYQCCGDDWIWIYNMPVDYSSSRSNSEQIALANENKLCLYSDSEADTPYGLPIAVEGMGSGTYRCEPPPGHKSYDPNLKLDDQGGAEGNMSGSPTMEYFFAGISPQETDVGKWSGGNTEKFCYHEFNNGEKFQWLSIPEAANKNQLICEIYLGYNWTGSRCCGPVSETYNDFEKHCNGMDTAMAVGGAFPFSSPSFEEAFFQECEVANTENSACFEGSAVLNNQPGLTDYPRKEVYNENGILHFCNRADGSVIYPEFDHVEKCTLKGANDNPSKTLAVCGYKDDSWQDAYSAAEFMGLNFGSASSIDELREGLHDSSFPLGSLGYQSSECCFFNSCWNGTECVERVGLIDGVYQYYQGSWSQYDGDLVKGKEVFICNGGSWMNSEADYNWYHDESNVNFCSQKQACYCSGPATFPEDYSCGEENVNQESCTIEENFYINDHYCEAEYSGSTVTGAKWTSRTKLIAYQLMEIAGSSDYVLYCDDYKISTNYPLPLEQTRYPINSVCTIEYDGEKAIGISFNPTDDSNIIINRSSDSNSDNGFSFDNEMDEFLFSPNNGFLKVIVGTDASECNVEGSSDSSLPHGKYTKCVSSQNSVWLNRKTNSLIYAKEGIDNRGNSLRIADYKSLNAIFDSEVSRISSFINTYSSSSTGSNTNNAGNNANTLKQNIESAGTASDFNRLYVLKQGNKEIFGYLETRHDPSSYPMPLANVMAVHYTGFDSVCDSVDFVNNRYYAGIACKESGNNAYVADITAYPNYPEYWLDLTAKIRLNELS